MSKMVDCTAVFQDETSRPLNVDAEKIIME